jgi:hypothetical protein
MEHMVALERLFQDQPLVASKQLLSIRLCQESSFGQRIPAAACITIDGKVENFELASKSIHGTFHLRIHLVVYTIHSPIRLRK